MEDNLENIKQELHIVKDQLQILIDKVDRLSTTSQKLDEHIDFIMSTYNTLKHPLDVLKNSVNSFSGYGYSIKDKQK
jgi:hypothetical protein